MFISVQKDWSKNLTFKVKKNYTKTLPVDKKMTKMRHVCKVGADQNVPLTLSQQPTCAKDMERNKNKHKIHLCQNACYLWFKF